MNAGTPPPSYKGFRFPQDIIAHAVWLYHRFSLSFRDVAELLFARGVVVTALSTPALDVVERRYGILRLGRHPRPHARIAAIASPLKSSRMQSGCTFASASATVTSRRCSPSAG